MSESWQRPFHKLVSSQWGKKSIRDVSESHLGAIKGLVTSLIEELR